MAGYIIIDEVITDETLFGEFAEKIGDVVSAHGGRFLVRGGAAEAITGDFTPHRVVVIEFESVERAREYLDSPEHLDLLRIRERSANTNMILVEGV